jgi:hypothetical protein
MYRLPALFVVLGVGALLIATRLSSAPAAAQPGGPDAGKGDSLRLVGTASCASAACHNGGGPQGSAGSEYTTWITRDKHARAYEVLFDKRSVEMAKRLKLGKAHEEKLCLSCHVHQHYEEARHTVRFSREDGVGCESCHGPAERWIADHHRPEWQQKSDRVKAALGFADTRSLLGRVRTCVDCHVGAPGSDVNHDLIAAGHPRLAFEFGAYHANMPRHWTTTKDRQRHPDLEARAWQVGQVVSAEAALSLLRSRAENKKAPWPEFAEYACAACHHDLQSPSWRQKRGDRNRGLLPWGGWYTALLPEAADAQVDGEIAELCKLMEKPLPNRQEVAAKAAAVLGKLKGIGRKLAEQPSADKLLPRFQAIVATGNKLATEGWDEAAQVFLALAAHHQALRDLDAPGVRPEWRSELQSLAKELAFPTGFDNPKGFNPQTFGERLKGLTASPK